MLATYIIIVAFLFSAFFYRVLAIGLPFGGFVASSIPCTCSAGFLLTVVPFPPPIGGQFVYQIGTPQLAWFMLPSPGVWTLGEYSPGGICLIFIGKGCAPIGVPIGTILPIVGTGLPVPI